MARNDYCPLLSLPGEIRNRIYEYAFSVDHIQSIQYDRPKNGAYKNEYQKYVVKYAMIFETRDSGNWRSVPQQLSALLALPQTCRQIRTEARSLPFFDNIFDVGLHTIQHFLTVVPKEILDGIKVISLWRNPGRQMDCVGDMVFVSYQTQIHQLNDIRVWRTLLAQLRALPALEKVVLNVRGYELEFVGSSAPTLQGFSENLLARIMGRKVEVELV